MSINKTVNSLLRYTSGVLFLAGIFTIIHALPTSAQSFNPGKIIDDTVFTNKESMSASQIQAFLNSKVPVCDTNGTQPSEYGGGTRAQWAQAKYGQSTFTCLKNYSEGGRSAAQIIYDTAQTYSINPQVLIVLLQKEQGLITDTWPLNIQYRSATGYGCPDTAPCDAQYYGLTNQLSWAGKMFRAIMNASSTWYTPYILGNNYIRYNPVASCGGSNVNIQNRSTQALYNYTPYQPNPAALAAPMGVTVDCGAYGNINFFRYFVSWFGSTTGPEYAWNADSAKLYTDSSLTQEIVKINGIYNVSPGQKVFAKVIAANIGRQPWPKEITRLGTQNVQDRSSPFADSSWLSSGRVGGYKESGDIPVGGTATFEFSMVAPSTPATYNEGFSIVLESRAWATAPANLFTVSVVKPLPEIYQSTKDTLPVGGELLRGKNIISKDTHSVAHMSFAGSLELWVNYRKVWSTNTDGSGADRLVNQSDGNLVLYKGSTPVWASNTHSSVPGGSLTLQPDGNLVLYKGDNSIWSTNTVTYNQLLVANSSLHPGQVMFPGQVLTTSDRYYRFVAQEDGNLVLYTPTRAIWASNTYMRKFNRFVFQEDGNMVTYNDNGVSLWSSNTFMSGGVNFIIQGDGNLVLYTPTRAIWASNTPGLR